MSDNINLVDLEGNRIGIIDKMEAHVTGQLHEAFSIFVFNEKKELLLQKRAFHKYHSGGLWNNTCCSHPKEKEALIIAIHRRLQEEMGFDCTLKEIDAICYKAEGLANNLIEYEFDHVFIGHIKETTIISLNEEEVCEYQWITIKQLRQDIKQYPQRFTSWFKIILNSPPFIKSL